jgi:hypothetical protein
LAFLFFDFFIFSFLVLGFLVFGPRFFILNLDFLNFHSWAGPFPTPAPPHTPISDGIFFRIRPTSQFWLAARQQQMSNETS